MTDESPKRRAIPSPSAYMRSRRPERFSDSSTFERPSISADLLGYHLENLTSKSQEADFARFAHAIAERRICPNLIPQTGPTGGGDSKVDSETYPVAEQLAVGWYEATNRKAASERWAFAFSAKKKWRPKLNADVAKIAETKRGYVKVHFITNQYVPDKRRAQAEDALSARYGFEVRVYDRTWLERSVLDHGLEDIAIAILGVTETIKAKRIVGSHDAAREQELEAAELRMAKSLASANPGPAVADDALLAALKTRGLERRREEVDGKFLRARDLAKRFGSRSLQLRVEYEWAWTTFWWYEDVSRFTELLDAAESIAVGSESPYHVELLSNLWICLQASVAQGRAEKNAVSLGHHTEVLLGELERLATQRTRAGVSAYARTMKLQVDLLRGATEPRAAFDELRRTIKKAEKLVGYPIEKFVGMIIELGDVAEGLDGYEEIFEMAVNVSARRKGEVRAAKLLLDRGQRLLLRNEPYKTIAVVGAALVRLYKHESLDDMVRALYLCGAAYEAVGLYWAARGALVNAASLATNEYWMFGRITEPQVKCADRLRWLELGLGRLPQLMAWHELYFALEGALAQKGEKNASGVDAGPDFFDPILGIRFLQAELSDLHQLEALPDRLDRMGLFLASSSLLYALGHDSELPDEMRSGEPDTDREKAFFRQLRDQPASKQLRQSLVLGSDPSVTLESVVLGCRVRTSAENRVPCVEIGESLHAALESLLSTALSTDVIAREASVRITIHCSEFGDAPIGWRIVEDEGQLQFFVTCRQFSPHNMALSEQQQVKAKVSEIIVAVLGRILMSRNIDAVLRKLLRDERALERSLSFTGSFVTVGNVLGHKQKGSITEWIDKNDRRFELRRPEVWDKTDRDARAIEAKESTRGPLTTPKGGEPPPALLDRAKAVTHNDIEVSAVIRMRLWDGARWLATGYLTVPGNPMPPVVFLLFENGKEATQIFEAWRSEIGHTDTERRIYLSFVRGISRADPNAYRVVIGGDPRRTFERTEAKLSVAMFRIQEMRPVTSENLERFLAAYGESERFLLAPAIVFRGESEPRIAHSLAIELRDAHVTEAWQVGRHDPSACAIYADDDPVIPETGAPAPVVELLELKRREGGSDGKRPR